MEQLLTVFFLAINFVSYVWMWFKTKTEAEVEPEAPRNPDISTSTPETVEMHIPDLICKLERTLPTNTKTSQIGDQIGDEIGEDTRTDEAKAEHFQTPATSEETVKRLEDDHKFFSKEISQFQRKFLNLSIIVSGFEDIQQENEKLNKEIASLQETASKNDSNRQTIDLQLKKENAELHEKLDRMEMENRTLASKLSFREFDTNLNNTQISDCKIATNQKQKQQLTPAISKGNDKRAASLQETASKWESDCLNIESRLIKEKNALQNSLDILKEGRQKKTTELGRVTEENRLLNSKFELAIETLNVKLGDLDQLKAELHELKGKHQAKSLLNDQLKKDLSSSQDIACKWKADYEKITIENDDLKAKLVVTLDENYDIKHELKMACLLAQQRKDLVNKQTTAINELKDDLYSADQENFYLIGLNEELQKKFALFSKNASVIETQRNNLQQEMIALKDNVLQRKNGWRSIKLQLTKENNDLKKALGRCQIQNQRISEAHEAAVLSEKLLSKNANKLAEKHEAANNILLSTVDELKQELSTYQSENDELKKRETYLRVAASQFELTISELRKDIEDLKSEMESHKKTSLSMISELERITGENHLLKSQLDSDNEIHEAKLKQQQMDTASLLELKSDEFEKEAIGLRQRIGFLQKENQQMWNSRESVVESAQKAEKMALEQTTALSEALTALQVAATHAKKVVAAEEVECVPEIANESETDFKPTENGDESRLKKWLTKHNMTSRKPVEEKKMRNLLKGTGISMIERAKILQQVAENLKVKGKDLKKKSKKRCRK